MKNKKVLIIGGVVLIILLAIGGVAAFLIIKNNQNNASQDSNQTAQNGGGRFTSDNIVSVQGKITSIDDKTVVVDTTDGNGERVVNISDNTNVVRNDTDTKDDILQQGKNIIVVGDKQGNNITAQTVLLPMIRNSSRSSDSSTSQSSSQFSRGNFRGFGGSGFQQAMGNNATLGMIDSINGDTVTMTDPRSNNQYTVTIQTSTVFKKQTRGTIADLKTDLNVNIFGTKDNSGTITARSINIQ